MTVTYEVILVSLFFLALIAKFVSDRTAQAWPKLLWFRTMQVAYFAVVVMLGIKVVPVAWPYIEQILSAQ